MLSAIWRSSNVWGVSVILPRSSFASRMSPTFNPARSRNRVGIVTWPLVLTLTKDIVLKVRESDSSILASLDHLSNEELAVYSMNAVAL